MAKILLKRVGRLTSEQYIAEVKRIARVTVDEQAKKNPYIEIYSYRDIIQEHLNGRKVDTDSVNTNGVNTIRR